jgi:hypothetical protein
MAEDIRRLPDRLGSQRRTPADRDQYSRRHYQMAESLWLSPALLVLFEALTRCCLEAGGPRSQLKSPPRSSRL